MRHVIESALATPGPALVEASSMRTSLPCRPRSSRRRHSLCRVNGRGTKDWQKIAATIAKDRVREMVGTHSNGRRRNRYQYAGRYADYSGLLSTDPDSIRRVGRHCHLGRYRSRGAIELTAGGKTGLVSRYTDPAASAIAEDLVEKDVIGKGRAFDIPDIHLLWTFEPATPGRPGLVSTAIAAVDNCLWDLKARCWELSLFRLLGQARTAIAAYGSGGFTSYSENS